MKKILLIGFLFLNTFSMLSAGRGGEAVVGALGGLAVGTMIGQATADSSSRRTARAEDEIRRVEDRQEMLREQDKERIARLERELERTRMKHKEKKSRQESQDPIMIFLIVLTVLLAASLAGLGFVVLRRRP